MTRKEYQLVFEALKSYKTFMTDQEKVLSEKILDSLFYQDRVDNEIKSLNFRQVNIMRYKSPNVIGLGDSVRYEGNDYLVLINYIKGETDAKNYTPKSNRTILIDDNGNRITCHNYKKLEILA